MQSGNPLTPGKQIGIKTGNLQLLPISLTLSAEINRSMAKQKIGPPGLLNSIL